MVTLIVTTAWIVQLGQHEKTTLNTFLNNRGLSLHTAIMSNDSNQHA